MGIIYAAVLFFGMFVGACVMFGLRSQADFNRRFPPISDEEFVARCGPGTDPKVALKVRRIVSEQLGVEYARIYPSTRFIEDLNAD